MGTVTLLLVYFQALGALIGVSAAVWSELAYIRAMRDGHVDTAERKHLEVIGTGLRFGMLLLLLSSFGLVVIGYELQLPLQPAYSPSYWMFMLLAFLVLAASWALSRKKISFALGSAVIFASWWFLAFLTIGQLPVLSVGATFFFLIVSIVLFYALLQYVRFLILRKK